MDDVSCSHNVHVYNNGYGHCYITTKHTDDVSCSHNVRVYNSGHEHCVIMNNQTYCLLFS